MSKSAAKPAPPAVDADEVRQQLFGKHVCPFCGVLRTDPAQPCPRCTLDDNAATRTATRMRIGPWFVLQARNPSAPGMRLATLQSLVRKGHVTPRSVVRGPTTEQMWTFAANVRGLSREFGLCYLCGEGIEATAEKCQHCGKGQGLPPDVDALLEPTAAPATPAPVPPPPEPPARPDFMSDTAVKPSDTGMDGGTSLDLQADALFPLADTRRPPSAPRPRPVVQRAPVPVKEDSILTARELAAAFQLDFKTPGSPGSKERRPVRTLAGLLVIAAVAATIVLALRPEWRRASLTWLMDQWSHVAASLEKPAKPAAPTGLANTGAVAPRQAVRPPAEPPRTVEPPAVVPPPPPVAVVPPKPEPKAEPVVVRPPPVAPAPPPVTPPAVAIPDDLTIEQATESASFLRLQAIDAQARGDWAGALRLYEQIEKLPHDAWPADLSMRMDVAKHRVDKP